MMKYVFIALLLLVSSPAAAGGNKVDFSVYTKALDRCDAIQKETLAKKDISNSEMQDSAYDVADCYQAVADKVIDKYYTKSAPEMKKHFKEYLTASYNVAADIVMEHNRCYGNCGTMMLVVYAEDASNHLKRMVQTLISYADLLENER